MKIGDKAYMAFLGVWGAGALYSTYKIPGLISGENKKNTNRTSAISA